MRVLLVEDERKLANSIQKGLSKRGYAVDTLEHGDEAMKRIGLHSMDYDLVILDLMLPGADGETIAKSMREKNINTPILVLTARDDTDSKVKLLSTGADDYLAKPFSFDELVARMEAILRRPVQMVPTVLKAGVIELNPSEHSAKVKDQSISLTLKEFRLLEYFMRHPNEVVNREDLLTHLWDFNYASFSNVVDVHVKNLRRKLTQAGCPEVLETIRGIGYRFTA